MEWTPIRNLKHLATKVLHPDHHDGLFSMIVASQPLGLDPQENPSSLLSITNLKPLNLWWGWYTRWYGCSWMQMNLKLKGYMKMKRWGKILEYDNAEGVMDNCVCMWSPRRMKEVRIKRVRCGLKMEVEGLCWWWLAKTPWWFWCSKDVIEVYIWWKSVWIRRNMLVVGGGQDEVDVVDHY